MRAMISMIYLVLESKFLYGDCGLCSVIGMKPAFKYIMASVGQRIREFFITTLLLYICIYVSLYCCCYNLLLLLFLPV